MKHILKTFHNNIISYTYFVQFLEFWIILLVHITLGTCSLPGSSALFRVIYPEIVDGKASDAGPGPHHFEYYLLGRHFLIYFANI